MALTDEDVQSARVTPISLFNPRVGPLPWSRNADQNVCGAPRCHPTTGRGQHDGSDRREDTSL